MVWYRNKGVSMEFKIRELTDNYMKFIVTDTSPSFVNTLRRVLIADVPKMAIEDVEFHLGPIRDNTGKEFESISPLFDEIIAHRLGLIPIPTDLKLFKPREECNCKGEGCPTCTIMYTLNKKGPCTVYSGDLEPLGDSKFKITEDLIPLVKLGENQALLIYATAELGTCKKHAKWQPTAGVGYKYYPKLEIDDKLCDKSGACIDICPKKIFARKDKKIVIQDNFEDCTLCNSCVEVCNPSTKGKGKSKPAIKVEGDENKFIFKFETDGSLKAIDVFEYALKYLEDKFNNFRDEVSKLK
jgi:DNA-directed RNA polymerase subunit D